MAELFSGPDEPRALLVFYVGGIELACHFFTPSEIEFDFDPGGVGEGELGCLLTFMADLGDLVGKVVVMTPENGRDEPMFKYDPSDRRVHWVPPVGTG